MNPGPVEEAGQTARSVITALAGNPGLLVLVLFNLIIMLALVIGIMHERADASEIMKALIAQCGPAT